MSQNINDGHNFLDSVFKILINGEPFEFLNGENLEVNYKFLQLLISKFPGKESVLVFGILGP